VATGGAVVECDDACHAAAQAKRKEKEEQENAKREEQLRRQQQEVEEFEWKMKGKRRKPRKNRVEEEVPTFMQKYGMRVIGPVLAVVLAVFVYYLFVTS